MGLVNPHWFLLNLNFDLTIWVVVRLPSTASEHRTPVSVRFVVLMIHRCGRGPGMLPVTGFTGEIVPRWKDDPES